MLFRKVNKSKQPDNSDVQDDISVASSLSQSCSSPLPNSTAFPEKEIDVSTAVKPGGHRIKPSALSAEERSTVTEGSTSEEGIEVEAVEFSKTKRNNDDNGRGLHCPRRIMLLIVAFLIIMTASATVGFWILSGDKSSSSSTTSMVSSSSAANDAEEGADVLNVTNNNSGTADPLPIDADQDGIIDLQGIMDSINREKAAENTTKPTLAPTESTPSPTPSPTIAPIPVSTPAPTFDPSSAPSATASIGSSKEVTGVSSGGTGESENVCPDHNLVVTSSCVEGSASALSIASFCFASKRDGDWYWVRGSDADNGTTRDYDSWDYTEEIEGELTLLDLGKGGYLISLVRDSMQPYDEIITHEFLVPECVANNE